MLVRKESIRSKNSLQGSPSLAALRAEVSLSPDFDRNLVQVANSNAMRYCHAMIRSFKDRDTQKVFEGQYLKKVPKDLTRTAERKLRIFNRAESLDDLRISPGNRLESLKGNRTGHMEYPCQ